MDSRSFPWIQMAQLHHTWQLRITSRRACIPSMVLSFKAMARRTGLFPASWDTNATRFLAQTWTRGWKAKVYRCTLSQLGEPSHTSQERRSLQWHAARWEPVGTGLWLSGSNITGNRHGVAGQQSQATVCRTLESTFSTSWKGKFGPMSDSHPDHPETT